MIALRRRTTPGFLALGFMLGCQTTTDAVPEVSGASEALSACDETVPANRNIDGIPAYTQCAATQNSAIFSNNGVDTSTTRTASDWVQTQFNGGYQCTELAHRYLYFKWQVKWIPNGNAGTWCDTTPPASSGLVQTTSAVHGDLMVLAPGSCGADTTYGHVNVIDTADATGKRLTAVEQNSAGRNTYMASCAKCFLHVVANNGATPPAAGASAAGAQAPKAGSGSAGSGAAAMTPPPSAAGVGLPVQLPMLAGQAAPPPPRSTGGGGSIAAVAGAVAPPLTAAGTGANSIAPVVTPNPPLAPSGNNRDAASPAAGGCGVVRTAGGAPGSSAPGLFGWALTGLLGARRWRRRTRCAASR
jgi:hypothetical protein